MKRIIITLCLVLAMAIPAHALEALHYSEKPTIEKSSDKGKYFTWDETNTKLHVPLTLLMMADLGQSLWAQEYHWSTGLSHEQNKIMGPYPSRAKVREYFAWSYIITTGMTYILPPKWSHGFQTGIITMEIIVVHHNYSVGVGVKF